MNYLDTGQGEKFPAKEMTGEELIATLLNQGQDAEGQRAFDKFLELAPDKKAFAEKWIEKTKQERTLGK